MDCGAYQNVAVVSKSSFCKVCQTEFLMTMQYNAAKHEPHDGYIEPWLRGRRAYVPITEQPELSIIGGRRARVLDCHDSINPLLVKPNATKLVMYNMYKTTEVWGDTAGIGKAAVAVYVDSR